MPIRWKLHEVMAKRRVRNKDLAAALDITENSVYRLRKADDMPRLTPQRLEGICAALQCQPGDLLEWFPEGSTLAGVIQRTVPPEAEKGFANSVVVQHAQPELSPLPVLALQRLTQYYQPILALAWQGYSEYGPGAVVFTDLGTGPKLAFVEQPDLTDASCQSAINRTDPTLAAVVLYYKDSDYSSSDYSLLILSGPKTPPECFALSYQA